MAPCRSASAEPECRAHSPWSPTALNFPPKKVHKSASLKLTIKNTGLGVLHGSIDATSELGAPFSA